jgi:hypothetical protein
MYHVWEAKLTASIAPLGSQEKKTEALIHRARAVYLSALHLAEYMVLRWLMKYGWDYLVEGPGESLTIRLGSSPSLAIPSMTVK